MTKDAADGRFSWGMPNTSSLYKPEVFVFACSRRAENIHQRAQNKKWNASLGLWLHPRLYIHAIYSTEICNLLWRDKKLQRKEIAELVGALIVLAETQGKVLVPGYTHLQRGQPIWIAHQLLKSNAL